MENKLREYFKLELHYAERMANQTDDRERQEVIFWNAYQRGLGAVNFARACEDIVSEELAEEYYEMIKLAEKKFNL